jgi:hypothetical protein
MRRSSDSTGAKAALGEGVAAMRKAKPKTSKVAAIKVASKAVASKKIAAPKPGVQSQADPQAQLDTFLDKYAPEVAAFARLALTKMRRLMPGAIEMIYDNYYALVVGFGPSERPSEAIFSIALYPNHVSLCFLQGARLQDPAGLLEGSGNVVRHIRLFTAGSPDPRRLDDRDIRMLIASGLLDARVQMPAKPQRKLIIRSISAKQRPRR